MPGGDAGNLFIQGALLREMAFMCCEEGCSLLIIHHTKIVPKERQHEPGTVRHRVGRLPGIRQTVVSDQPSHHLRARKRQPELWLNVGSSVGHGGLWGVDVSEGVLGQSLRGTGT